MSTTYEKQNHLEYSEWPETPVAEIRSPATKDNSVPVSNYCEYHKLHSALLPLPGREYNPVEVLKEVHDGLEQLNDLAETYTIREIHGGSIPHKFIAGIHVLFGTTRMHDTSRGMRYRNPNYVHYDARTQPITDADKRIEFYERHRINPGLTTTWLAKHWGLSSQNGACKFLNRKGYNLSDDNREAMTRIGRTALCIREWCDIPLDRLAEWMPWNPSTIRGWASRFGLQADDWNVPRDVRQARWFMTSGNTRYNRD